MDASGTLHTLLSNPPIALTGLLLVGAALVLAAVLTWQDLRSCHLSNSLLSTWCVLGVSLGWLLACSTLPRPPPTPDLSLYLPLISTVLKRSASNMIPLLLLSLVLPGGIGGGDLRYLLGLSFILPLQAHYLTLFVASLLSLFIQLLVRLAMPRTDSVRRYRAQAFLPPLNLALLGTIISLLVEL